MRDASGITRRNRIRKLARQRHAVLSERAGTTAYPSLTSVVSMAAVDPNGGRLKALRELHGLTQVELSSQVGIRQSAISDIEKRRSAAHAERGRDSLTALASAAECRLPG